MNELIQNGFEFVFTAIAADGLDENWLNVKITKKELSKLFKIKGIMVNGEGGEFESLVTDCPLFTKKIELISFHKEMDTSCSGRLIIEEAKLIEK